MEAADNQGAVPREVAFIWLGGSLLVWAVSVLLTGAIVLTGQLRQAEEAFLLDSSTVARQIELRLRLNDHVLDAIAAFVETGGEPPTRLIANYTDRLAGDVAHIRQVFLLTADPRAVSPTVEPLLTRGVRVMESPAGLDRLTTAGSGGGAQGRFLTFADGASGYRLVRPLAEPSARNRRSRYLVLDFALAPLLPVPAALPRGLGVALHPVGDSGERPVWVGGPQDGWSTGFPALRTVYQFGGSAALALTAYRQLGWSAIHPETAAIFLATAGISLLAAYRHGRGRIRRECERRSAELKLYQMANYDSLTGLPNRNLFKDRLQRAILRAGRSSSGVALCFVDLDGFKAVNDTAGHDAGDQLLQMVARRLVGAVRAHDTVARLSGDEFVVVLEGIRTKADGELVVRKIRDTFIEAFVIGDFQFLLTASVGLAVYPEDGHEPAQLLRHADARMYALKYPEWVSDATPSWMPAPADRGAAPESRRLA